ncbi:nitrilase-related carbon-nitrogen hydrolase [Ruminobacter sp. RM87]|uniref:nitrilase-related carbon-nitrogen hydrolase n=1 Tax=Ruminobacter sp. RM87 TaxID=1200567 RepID=UPI00068BFF55|nr:nitrilase-related carbon-nitrogen hydrolase [Ruminobacter sp. RM87]
MNDCRVVVIELPAGKRSVADTLIQVDMQLESLLSFDGETLVVLPENFACCSRDNHDYEILSRSWNSAIDSLGKLARKHDVYLVAGTLPEYEEGRFYITSAVFDKSGRLIAKYRKINLFKALVGGVLYDEGSFYTPGTETVTFTVGHVRVGIAICFDLRFPEIFAKLRQQGSDIIIVPAAFTRRTGLKHWHVLLKARAIENQLYVVGAGLNGTSQDGYECYGHSLIIDPDGNVVTEALEINDFQIIEHKIDLELKLNIRKCMPLTAKL